MKTSGSPPLNTEMMSCWWLANQEYKDVIALIPAGQADAICKFFEQAPGVTDRRLISEKVRKNIQAYAPRCKRSGDISGDAEAYLLAWSSGEAPQLPAPQNYSILSYTRPRAKLGAAATKPAYFSPGRRGNTWLV